MYVEKFKTLEWWNGYAAQIKIRNTCSLSGQLDEYEGLRELSMGDGLGLCPHADKCLNSVMKHVC
jgi:hypothetical protein